MISARGNPWQIRSRVQSRLRVRRTHRSQLAGGGGGGRCWQSPQWIVVAAAGLGLLSDCSELRSSRPGCCICTERRPGIFVPDYRRTHRAILKQMREEWRARRIDSL